MRTYWIILFLLFVNILSQNATIYIFYTKSGSAILKLDDVQKTVQNGNEKYKVLDSKNQNGVLTLYCDNSTYFECVENSSKVQIKKYQFVSIQNVKLFHWDGMGDYSIDDIESTYAKNIDNELKNLDLNNRDIQKIRNCTYEIINAIKSGNIKGKDSSGRFLIYGRNDLSSTGVNKTNWLGNYKKDEDFYLNVSYAIIDNIIKKTYIYTPQKKATLINFWDIERVEEDGKIASNENANLSNEKSMQNISNLAIRNFNDSKNYLAKNDITNAIYLLEQAIENGMPIDMIADMTKSTYKIMLETESKERAMENILYTSVLLRHPSEFSDDDKKTLYFIRGLSKILLDDLSYKDDLLLGGEEGKILLDELNNSRNQKNKNQIKCRSLKKDPNFKIK